MKWYSARSLRVTAVNDIEGFAELETEWEDLYENSIQATPFQSWAWLYSWWESYGETYRPYLVTIRDGALLVGIIPLMLQRWGDSNGRLLFIGTGLTDYLDILVRDGWKERVTTAGVEALRVMSPSKIIDLYDLSPEAAAFDLCRKWPGPRLYILRDSWQGWGLGYPVRDVESWDELLMSVSSRLRKNARRSLRRAEEDGVRCVVAEPDEAEQAARRLVALHREMLGERVNPEHETESFESYIVAVARRLAACEAGRIYEFWRDGDVIASHLLLLGHTFVGDYMVGVREEALQRYQMHSLFMWNAVRVARSRGITCINLLQGEEPYKLRWASEVVYNHRVVLSKKPVRENRNRGGARRRTVPGRRPLPML